MEDVNPFGVFDRVIEARAACIPDRVICNDDEFQCPTYEVNNYERLETLMGRLRLHEGHKSLRQRIGAWCGRVGLAIAIRFHSDLDLADKFPSFDSRDSGGQFDPGVQGFDRLK